jgi:Ca2+-binding EF-hand superfamily protein
MSAPSRDEIKEVFDTFDADGSGYIDSAEIKSVCEQLGVEPSQEEIDAIIAEADANGDGKVSFDEFCKAITG